LIKTILEEHNATLLFSRATQILSQDASLISEARQEYILPAEQASLDGSIATCGYGV
jgi:hypothetical protein